MAVARRATLDTTQGTWVLVLGFKNAEKCWAEGLEGVVRRQSSGGMFLEVEVTGHVGTGWLFYPDELEILASEQAALLELGR